MLHPDPPSALGNAPPPYAATLALPGAPPAREGRLVEIGERIAVDLGARRKILVPKLDFIGDWVLATPFLAGLRHSAPQAEITVVVLDRVYDLAAPCRFADRVISVGAASHGPVRFAAGDAEMLSAFVADMEKGVFDLALAPRWDSDFNGALRLAGLSGAETVVAFSEGCTARKQVDNRGDDRFCTAALLDLRDCHEVEHNLGLLAAIGGTGEACLSLDLTEADRHAAAMFRSGNFGDSTRPMLALAPFAAGRRQWPLERSVALARRLATDFGMDIAVIGSSESAADAARVAAQARSENGHAVSAAGRLGLRESAALIGSASLLIGMDSGPGHIAAALGIPVATLFSNPAGASQRHVSAPERFRPWAPPERLHIIRPPRHAAPCTDGCDDDHPHCILGIEVDDVYPRLAEFAVPSSG